MKKQSPVVFFKHGEFWVWLQEKADVLKPGMEHGKITATVSCYMVKIMPVHIVKAYVGGGR